jgi:hypothetical protein
MKFLCWLSFHDWRYFAVSRDCRRCLRTEEEMALPSRLGFRRWRRVS